MIHLIFGLYHSEVNTLPFLFFFYIFHISCPELHFDFILVLCVLSPSTVFQQYFSTLSTWAWPNLVQHTGLWPVYHIWSSCLGQRARLQKGDLIHWGWLGKSLCDPASWGWDRSETLCVSCVHHCVSDLNYFLFIFFDLNGFCFECAFPSQVLFLVRTFKKRLRNKFSTCSSPNLT